MISHDLKALKSISSRAISYHLITAVFALFLVFGSSAVGFAKEGFFNFVPAETSYLAYFKMRNLENLRSLLGPASPFEEKQLEEMSPPRRMFMILAHKISEGLRSDIGLSSLGLSELSEQEIGLHGLGLWPVISFKVSDQRRFTRLIAQSAKQSELTLELQGTSLVFDMNDPKSKLKAVISFSGDQWSHLAFIPETHLKGLLPLLSGQAKPMVSMKRAKMFKSWTKGAKVSEESALFLSFERLARTLLGRGRGLNKRFAWFDESLQKSVPPSCVDEYLELLSSAPYLIIGRDSLSKEGEYRGRLHWRFSKALAEASRSVIGQDVYLNENANSLFSMSLAINLKGLLSAIDTFLLSRLERPFTCPHLSDLGSAEKLQALSNKLKMLPPFAFDFKGISLVVDQANPIPNARLILSAHNVPNLISILKAIQPQLATLTLPAVGSGPQALEGLPLPPSIKVLAELKTDALGVSIGTNQSEKVTKVLSSTPVKSPALYSFMFDVERVTKLFKDYLSASQNALKRSLEAQHRLALEQAKLNGTTPPPPPEMPKTPLDTLKQVEGIKVGRLSLELQIEDQGLDFSYQLQLQD